MRVFELKFEVRFGKNFALFVGYAFCYYVQPSHIETQKVLGKLQFLIWDNASLVEIFSQAGTDGPKDFRNRNIVKKLQKCH